MNRNRYRLVFNATLGMMVPVCETARRQGKSGGGRGTSGSALALAGVLLAGPAWGELPVAGGNYAAPGTIANYHTNGAAQAYMNQVGNKAIVNFDRFNLSAGHDVQLRQVHQLPAGFNDPAALVNGANFSTLALIHDLNPSVIAGSISQAAGQKANLIMVNSNGIAFMNGSQVNLNTFTASTLNIDVDKFFLGNLLGGSDQIPQFENALDGGVARGFIKVMEGARITASDRGRVMLIAPTVVNKGKVEAADGQVILAAGTKVYLRSASGVDSSVRGLLVEVDSPEALNDANTANTSIKDGQLDGQTVALTNAAEDKLGHVSNFGELSTARGNTTMIGYAVNQHGIARATTSVLANGSIYLMGKDRATTNSESTRGGRVVLGAGSLTEVLAETVDTTGAQDSKTAGTGLENPSRVTVLGQQIDVLGGARIVATASEVKLTAQDNPGEGESGTSSPFTNAGADKLSNSARVHIRDGAHIDVSGLRDVTVSSARNSVEVELRGDELKDSPVNQQGPIRSEKVYVDLNRALARANAGQSTLISRDALESNLAKQERTVAERSTSGGKVIVQSQGEALLDAGARIDLSGGSVKYTAGNVKTTLLTSAGNTIDVSDADAETRYDGISTRVVIDYGPWNRQEVIDLGQSYRYETGYVEGKNAGALSVVGMKTTDMQASVIGETVTGTLQRNAGVQPTGAKLTLGKSGVENDFKLNQKVVMGTALPSEINTLALNPALFGAGKIANLEVFSNQATEVREALRLPQGGSVSVVAKGVSVNADVVAHGGRIAFRAADNSINTAPMALDVRAADGVSLDASGQWGNDLPAAGASSASTLIHGGTVNLVALNALTLGAGTEINTDSGGQLKADGKLVAGNGGSVSLDGGAMQLDGDIHGYALGKGGALTLKTSAIQVGGTDNPNALNLDPAFFSRGGFAQFNLNGDTAIDIADGTLIQPRLSNAELRSDAFLRPTGTAMRELVTLAERDARVRQAVNVSFSSSGAGNATAGRIRLGENARILADNRANINFTAKSGIDLLGEVRAAGGTVTAALNRGSETFDPAAAIRLGERAVVDVSGTAQTYRDNKGLTQGTVLAGGTVGLDAQRGYVTTAAGSRINVSGAAPVQLDMLNEQGRLGRMVGNDAGTVRVTSTEGIILDGDLQARAGGMNHRGGTLDIQLAQRGEDPTATYPVGERTLSVQPTLAPQLAGLAPGAAIPTQQNGNSTLDASRLEGSGADRILLSAETIQLSDGLNLGGARSAPLRELALTAQNLATRGGDAAVTADTVRLGNGGRQSTVIAPVAGTGTLTVNARLLDVAGDLNLSGMDKTVLKGNEQVRFSLNGTLSTQADVVLHGALVAPATAVQYTIDATGRQVAFTRDTSRPLPAQPLSAFGGLTVKADSIDQGGAIWAPFGQLAFDAQNTLVFRDGSLTSVAAGANTLTPYGRIENGQSWVYGSDASDVTVDNLPQKSIRTTGASIDMQTGARLDLAGGGNLQAYEFTVGPGGSRDILADKSTYAILPGYSGGFAPVDIQEGFDRASGEAVYLAGVPGLADGVYTLLPAHYALLPGAYAVKLGGASVLPGQAYTRQDGIRVAAGYVTDTRIAAPRDADWQGVQVFTRDQVRARSEFTLVRASDFFVDGSVRPQDAGLLSVRTTGAGANALKLDALYDFDPASGGRGGQLDISALKLAITSGPVAGLAADTVVLDAGALNALGADSVLLGATRTQSGDATTLDVGAQAITLANDADHALRGGEVMLAASDTVTLKSGSAIQAQGTGGAARHYTTAGNGALVRAASTTATLARTGSPDGSLGTLAGEAGSQITASGMITLDATRDNTFEGDVRFSQNGTPVAGTLAVGASRVSFGAAPAGTEGLVYSQVELDALDLGGLMLTSYSTFDLHGGVAVGKLDGNGKPVLQNLTLQGAGLAGIDNAGQTAQLNARNLTLTNTGNSATFTPAGTLGSGTLVATADTITLGAGDKQIQGFGQVTVNANELAGSGKGTLTVTAPLTLNVARISGERGADQGIASVGAIQVASRIADRTLAPTTALGASWALKGTAVDFNSAAELGSGTLKLTATSGDVKLGANAKVDVAGRAVKFFDQVRSSWGGTAEFVSETGNVDFDPGARLDVSGAPGADAGTFIVRARNGTFNVASGSLQGQRPAEPDDGFRGEGARAQIDVGTLASFSTLNSALNAGGFDGERDLRLRGGNLVVDTVDTVRAESLRIAVDNGHLTVKGALDASGDAGGRIALYAGNNLVVDAGAQLLARANAVEGDGGTVELGSVNGTLNLAAGSSVDVSGGTNGQNGTVHLRARRDGIGVAVDKLDSTLTGARAVNLEAVKTYTGIDTLNATGTSSGSTLTLATINADNTAYADNHGKIKTDLGKAGDARFHVLSGVEVQSNGDLTLAQDWNLKDSRAGGETGVLTLRAAGNLKLDSNLSDGFSHTTAFSTGTTPATLLSDASWSYQLVGGADTTAANALATTTGAGDVALKADKLARTGTGDIRIASGRNIVFGDNKSAVYTAGQRVDPVPGFTMPAGPSDAVNYAQFSQGGGNVELTAQGDIGGTKRAQQLYSNWLFRQGRLTADETGYAVQPAWWVRFDQFQQGVGALGGGNVVIKAGGKIENLSASAPTQAYLPSAVPDQTALVTTGGGNVRVEAGTDLLGGQYYADKGELVVRVRGALGSGESVSNKPLYPVLALGDSQARIQADNAVNIQAVINPHLVVQASRNAGGAASNNISTTGNTTSINSLWSVFSTLSERSAVRAESLSQGVVLHENVTSSNRESASLQAAFASTRPISTLLNFGISTNNYKAADALLALPPTLTITAFQGDVLIDGSESLILGAAPGAGLELYAKGSIQFDQRLVMSDADTLPDTTRPATRTSALKDASLINPAQSHAAIPVHLNDLAPARIYAATGDVAGKSNSLSLTLPKAAIVKAGRDVLDLGMSIQHVNPANSISQIEAGRDVKYIPLTSGGRSKNSYVWVGGPGRLEVTAGRDIDLGTSAGFVSRGNLDNVALPATGASIHLAAGVGAAGVDYAGAVDRLTARLASGDASDSDLWLARWLVGDDTLNSSNALAAVQTINAAPVETQRTRVRTMLFDALRTSGRDANKPESPYAGEVARGYAALALLFPGIEERNPDGSFKHYQGEIDLFASRVVTERGGDIEYLVPGGDIIVGLANTTDSQLDTDKPGSGNGLRDAGVLGIASVESGDIRGAVRGNMLVNQSRILTVGGGDVLLWSSEGDIDAGKGKKSASVVPPPISLVDADGNVTQVLQGAAAGSGISALTPAGGTAGDVDLIAFRGRINAGDAGIRAQNFNGVGEIIGGNNIAVIGTATGTPVADTSAVTAASSGASNAGGDVSATTAALADNLAEAARAAEELKKAFKPTFISAEVVGYGE